jgi:ABC-2 type transport system ATP-binding protein
MPAVELRALTRSYGGATGIDGLDLVVPDGALFGLVGPNGAGKSTCLGVVTTLLPPTSGTALVCGFDVAREPMEVKRRVGYAPEEPLLYGGLTARELVQLSATLHGVPEADGSELLAAFDLTSRADDLIASYSKGMKRKALLAAAMVHDPPLLVLDEPLEGLDVIAQARLKDLLRARVARGRTVLYSSHIVEVVEQLCSHVALLDKGRLLAAGALAEVRTQLGGKTLLQAFTER